MPKKRSCRRTNQEHAIHEFAIKLRKLTDQQLFDAWNVNYDLGYQHGGNKELMPFVDFLQNYPGIEAATFSRIKAAYDNYKALNDKEE